MPREEENWDKVFPVALFSLFMLLFRKLQLASPHTLSER